MEDNPPQKPNLRERTVDVLAQTLMFWLLVVLITSNLPERATPWVLSAIASWNVASFALRRTGRADLGSRLGIAVRYALSARAVRRFRVIVHQVVRILPRVIESLATFLSEAGMQLLGWAILLALIWLVVTVTAAIPISLAIIIGAIIIARSRR